MNKTKYSKIGFLSGVALLGTLTGCIGYVHGPRHGRVHAQPPSVHVETGVVVEPAYVYYPTHEVYYSSHTRQYVYLEGRSWVTRPAPPHVSVDVLFASPSVRLDFNDAPEVHHQTVVRKYPKHWAPPGHNRDKHENQGNGRQKNR